MYCRAMSDINQSGTLYFPEFVLAMYLCNLKLLGHNIPTVLPERIKNEVLSAVENYVSNDTGSSRSQRRWSSDQNLDEPFRQMRLSPRTVHQSELPPSSIRSESNRIGTLSSGQLTRTSDRLAPLDGLKQLLLPQQQRDGRSILGKSLGNAIVGWAITRNQRQQYAELFRAWVGADEAYLTGEQAVSVLRQSGLDKADLEKIWTLADRHDQGFLYQDEFFVALHLTYRKLNGYPVPNRLPPELIPPLTYTA